MLDWEKAISLHNMKNIGVIKTFTFTSLLLVFILQGIWLYRAYKETEAKLYLEINNEFGGAVEKELMTRFTQYNDVTLKNEPKAKTKNQDPYVLFDSGTSKLSNEDPSEDLSIAIQEYLFFEKEFLSIDSISAIFSELLLNKNIHGKFLINQINIKTGKILEATDETYQDSLKGAFYSDIIPVRMDKNEGVQVVLVSPYRAVFLQMIFILMLSILLILFVAYAIFYQMNSLLKEKHLRQLHTDFSHALTHDMATPLQTIAQVNNLLANEKLYNDPDKRTKYIDIARQQILNLQALTDRILTVARAEKSALEVNLSPVNLKEIILPLADKFKVQAKKPVEFEVSFSPEHINLQADATLLSNVVSNLIDNAVKYSGNTVKIAIRCEQKGTDVFIHVKDNGYGMSEKDQAKVFTMFERGKAVARKEAKGFGLGLGYVKSVVEAHGGAVSVFSKEGEGTEFVLFLPDSFETPTDSQFSI